MPAQIHVVPSHRRHRARGIYRRVALHQNHSRHVARLQMAVVGSSGRRSALRGHKTKILQLWRELLKRRWLKSREYQRGFNRLKRGTAPESSKARRRCVTRNRPGRLPYHYIRRRPQNILDRRYSRNRLLRERAQLQRERSRQFAFKINRAAAHPSYDAGMLHLRAHQLHQDDGLFRTHEIIHDPEHHQLELLNLISLENRKRVAAHSGMDLIQRNNFCGLASQGLGGTTTKGSQERKCGENNGKEARATSNRVKRGPVRKSVHAYL